ncbi:MAG: hypothetical protein J6T92_01595, partial [Ottowia sp.]|nr:hypothetical protein [Ottowia sp.]
MTSQTSWRMLAISAAVAVMLTACGSGGDGDNNGALTKPAADVRLSVDSASNTVTVRLVDADGNVVPVSRDVTVEVPAGSGNTTTVSLTDGVGTFSIPPSANGTDFVVTDPSTGNTFSGTAPNVRFRQDANGNVVVELTGADGNPFAASSQTGVNSAITNANTVDLGSGSASVAIDTQNLGAVPFTLTDPDTGNTFTGIVDTGSYTDANGYYVLGCNDKSPA